VRRGLASGVWQGAETVLGPRTGSDFKARLTYRNKPSRLFLKGAISHGSDTEGGTRAPLEGAFTVATHHTTPRWPHSAGPPATHAPPCPLLRVAAQLFFSFSLSLFLSRALSLSLSLARSRARALSRSLSRARARSLSLARFLKLQISRLSAAEINAPPPLKDHPTILACHILGRASSRVVPRMEDVGGRDVSALLPGRAEIRLPCSPGVALPEGGERARAAA